MNKELTPMKDEIIIKLLEDACKGLEKVNFPVTTPNLMPIYQTLVLSAAQNHPENLFLRTLARLQENSMPDAGGSEESRGFLKKSDKRDSGPEEMRILFGQLRIVLESLQEPPPRQSEPL
jgi:hypothetical protein